MTTGCDDGDRCTSFGKRQCSSVLFPLQHFQPIFKSFKVIQNTSAPVLAGRKQVLLPISIPGRTSTQACKQKLRNMLLTFLAQHLQRSSWNIICLGSLQGTHFLLPHSNYSFLRTSGLHFFFLMFLGEYLGFDRGILTNKMNYQNRQINKIRCFPNFFFLYFSNQKIVGNRQRKYFFPLKQIQ